jgi:hypothetical protein
MKLKSNEKMALSYIALNLADYCTTKYLLKHGGQELNPIARFLMKKKRFGLFKFISTAIGSSIMYFEDQPEESSKTIIGIYSAVVLNNFIQILKYKSNKNKT